MAGSSGPRRPSSHEIGERAVNAVERIILDAGWIFRRQSGADYGIDGEIEAVADGVASGRLAKIQIKGAVRARWQRSGTTRVRIKTSTLFAWASLPLPVIVVLHVEAEDAVYWVSPSLSRVPRGPSTAIVFERVQRLEPALAGLKQAMLSWYSGYGEHVLQEVPAFGRIFERLVDVAEFDPFTPIEQETDDELRIFYRHLFRLVAYTQTQSVELPQLAWWYACDDVVWPDDDGLHYWTLRHLLAYVGPTYRAAREALRALLNGSSARYFDREIEAAADFLEQTDVPDVGMDGQDALTSFQQAVAAAAEGSG